MIKQEFEAKITRPKKGFYKMALFYLFYMTSENNTSKIIKNTKKYALTIVFNAYTVKKRQNVAQMSLKLSLKNDLKL